MIHPNDIKITICCITYNHEPYIRDALDGFLAQRTNFPFEILVHDDCSTDSTANIVREYEAAHPHLIRLIQPRENQYSQGLLAVSVTHVYEQARGTYIAFCKGDDYWTYDNKLQWQVDYIESHKDCSVTAHAVDIMSGQIEMRWFRWLWITLKNRRGNRA